MNQITTILFILFIGTENPEIIQLTKDNKFKLDGFNVQDSYVLNQKERFVIANQLTTDNAKIEGLRLLYIEENKIKFKSEDVGESYIYRPTFYKFKDDRIIIVCELGFEYSTGVDVFEYNKGQITKLGYIDIASNVDDNNPASIVPNMTIEFMYGDQYNFKFKGRVFINPGGKDETKIEGEKLKGIYIRDTRKISLMIKSK